MSIIRSPYVKSTSKGKSFNFSEWDNLTAYSNNALIQDFVVFSGALYACIKDVPAGSVNPRVDTVDGAIQGKYWLQVIKGIKGPKGNDGIDGKDGKTYVPSVSSSGVLSWKENSNIVPGPINIKGPKGDPGTGLEFNWKDTKLQVRQAGSTTWSSSPDLKQNKIYVPNVKNGNLTFSLQDLTTSLPEFNFGSIKGKDGINGSNGKNGVDGKNGKDGKDGANGKDGRDGKNGKDGRNGVQGRDGLSAYQVACRAGFSGSIEDWLNSLKGGNGNNVILRVDTDPALFPDENYCGTHIQWKYDSEDYTEWRNLIQINQLMNLALGGINLEYKGIIFHEGKKCQHLILNYYEIDYIDSDGKIIFGDKIRKVSDVYIPVVRMTWEDDDPKDEGPYYILQIVCLDPISGVTVKLNGTEANEVTVPEGTEVYVEVSAPCYETHYESIIVNKDIYKEITLNKT